MEPEMDKTQSKTQPTAPKPPPIFVAGVHNIQPIHDLLIEIAADAFELKVLQGNQVKILPKSPDVYRTIIKSLTEKHTEFHTYQPKEDRSFRTVLRVLHYSADIQDWRAAIESHGHIVANIHNIKQVRSNIHLPLFFIDLKPNENNKDIYLIRTLLYTQTKTLYPPAHQMPTLRAQTKHTAIIPHVASNAPGATILRTVPVKINRTQSNVYYVAVIIPQITKAVLFIKIYRREHSHRPIGDRMPHDLQMINTCVLHQHPPMLLPSAPPQSNLCLLVLTHLR
jgi:hypothetical protein